MIAPNDINSSRLKATCGIGAEYRFTYFFAQERVADELTQTLDDDSRSAIDPKRICASGSCYYPIKRYLNASNKLSNIDIVPTDSANGFVSKFDMK